MIIDIEKSRAKAIKQIELWQSEIPIDMELNGLKGMNCFRHLSEIKKNIELSNNIISIKWHLARAKSYYNNVVKLLKE